MVQTVCTHLVLVGNKIIMLKKPLVLKRIFFNIRALTNFSAWHEARISLGDPFFRSYFSLNGSEKNFMAEGEDIFQGNIWIANMSDVDILFTATEILR